NCLRYSSTSSLVGSLSRIRHSRLPTGSHHRIEYLHVPSATTKISSQPVVNVRFARLRIFLEQTNGGHHHAWSTNAALCPAAFDESLLHRVQLISSRDSLDRLNLCALNLRDRHQATVHDLAINHHRASSTFAFAATFFRSGQF